MQDQYVGDIGDFGKYAWLKFLAVGDVVLRIVWYLTRTKGGSADGGFIQYLSSPDEANGLGNCDKELFDTLREIVQGGDRRVAGVRERCILPHRTQFYEERLDFDGVPPQERPEVRKSWCEKALKQVEEATLAFLDPDNSLSLNEKTKYRKTGPKYVFLDKIRQFLSRRQSLIVYCHQDRRSGGLTEQVRQGIELFSKESPIHEAWAFTFHRRSVRIYFVVPGPEPMAELLARRSTDFIRGCFGAARHFRLGGFP
jgi:hypothetical protein